MADSQGNETPALRPIYANYVHAQGGPFEITLDVGYRCGPEDPEVAARVVMSWEHLSVLLKVLQKQLDEYQEQVGPLPNLVQEEEEASP